MIRPGRLSPSPCTNRYALVGVAGPKPRCCLSWRQFCSLDFQNATLGSMASKAIIRMAMEPSPTCPVPKSRSRLSNTCTQSPMKASSNSWMAPENTQGCFLRRLTSFPGFRTAFFTGWCKVGGIL